jgi:hypothetical protein
MLRAISIPPATVSWRDGQESGPRFCCMSPRCSAQSYMCEPTRLPRFFIARVTEAVMSAITDVGGGWVGFWGVIEHNLLPSKSRRTP